MPKRMMQVGVGADGFLGRFGVELELKTVDASQRIIEGYAAIAETPDRIRDVIDKKAFARTLRKDPGDVAVFIAHNADALPVGIPLEIKFDGKGLYTKTKVFNTHAGDDLLAVASELKAHGRSLGQSIGYKAYDAARETWTDGKAARRLLDIDIKEYSFAPTQTIVHPDALVTAVKAMSEGLDSAGGYLTQTVVDHLRDIHKQHCNSEACPLCCNEESDDDDDDDDTGGDSAKSGSTLSPVSYVTDLYCDPPSFKAERDFSDKQREKLAQAGAAMPEGSFPIPDKDALRRAIQSFGRAKNKAAVKRHIIRRARALGATDMLPDGWAGGDGDNAKAVWPLFERFFEKKCGMQTVEGSYRQQDLYTASAVLQGLSRWIESELAEGDTSSMQAKALYRAMVLVTNTMRSEIEEYYGSAGAAAQANGDAVAVTEGGEIKTDTETDAALTDEVKAEAATTDASAGVEDGGNARVDTEWDIDDVLRDLDDIGIGLALAGAR